MPFNDETMNRGVDPLAMDNDDEQPQDNNIERIEHAPGENRKDENTTENDGRIYLWLSLLVAVVGAVVIVVVVVVAGGDDGDDGTSASTAAANTATFPPIAMVNDMQTQLDMIRSACEAEQVTQSLLDVIPPTVEELEVEYLEQDAHAAVQAAAWVVLRDEYNAENQIVERFALATVYFETEGANWIEKDNWMTSTSLCDDWYGIECCGNLAFNSNTLCVGKHPDHLSFLDLSENNLSGPFSVTYALLKDLHALKLDWNNLTGPLKGDIVGAMPNLQTLWVQHNRLTGPFDPSLVFGGALSTYYAQGNYFTGDWPAEYCVLYAYNFDCFRNKCMGDCCFSTDRLDVCTDLSHYYEDEPSDEDNVFGG